MAKEQTPQDRLSEYYRRTSPTKPRPGAPSRHLDRNPVVREGYDPLFGEYSDRAIAQLQKENPGWERGDLIDLATTVAVNLTREQAAIQRRYQELVRKYGESTQEGAFWDAPKMGPGWHKIRITVKNPRDVKMVVGSVEERPELKVDSVGPDYVVVTGDSVPMALMIQSLANLGVLKDRGLAYESTQEGSIREEQRTDINPGEARGAFNLLARLLKTTPLPTMSGEMRTNVDPDEFMLMSLEPAMSVYLFKHRNTRNYIGVNTRTGKLEVYQSSKPFFRGFFDESIQEAGRGGFFSKQVQKIGLAITQASADLERVIDFISYVTSGSGSKPRYPVSDEPALDASEKREAQDAADGARAVKRDVDAAVDKFIKNRIDHDIRSLDDFMPFESAQKKGAALQEAEAGKLPTEKELVDYLRSQGPGAFVSAMTMGYGFGISPQKVTGFLQKLLKKGTLRAKQPPPGRKWNTKEIKYELNESSTPAPIQEAPFKHSIFIGNLGSEATVKKVKKVLQGKTYMNFEVQAGPDAGNWGTYVLTNYNASREEVLEFIIFVLAGAL